MDEFLQAQTEMGKPGVPGWWENLPLTEQQQADLDVAARNPSISHRAIMTVLGRWGVQVTLGQVGHWRRDHVPGYRGTP